MSRGAAADVQSCAAPETTGHDFAGQRSFDQALERPPQRPRAEAAVGLASENFFGDGVVDLETDAAFC